MPLLMLPLHERLGVGREIDLETFILNGMSPSTPSSQGSGNTMEEEADRVQEPEGKRIWRNQDPLTWAKLIDTHRAWRNMHWVATGLFQVFCPYTIAFNLVFTWDCAWMTGSLIVGSSLGLFSFSWSDLSTPKWQVLVYLIIFYFVII